MLAHARYVRSCPVGGHSLARSARQLCATTEGARFIRSPRRRAIGIRGGLSAPIFSRSSNSREARTGSAALRTSPLALAPLRILSTYVGLRRSTTTGRNVGLGRTVEFAQPA